MESMQSLSYHAPTYSILNLLIDNCNNEYLKCAALKQWLITLNINEAHSLWFATGTDKSILLLSAIKIHKIKHGAAHDQLKGSETNWRRIVKTKKDIRVTRYQ